MKCLECDTKMELMPRRKEGQKLTTLYHACPECGEVHDHESTLRRD
jgi:DNA-directed RNA polymerase subunit RPC12/RpoP